MASRRTVLGLAVVLLAAGCTAGTGPATAPAVTPVAVPSDPSPTPAFRLAPGLSEVGVVAPLTLVSAHAERLRSTTYRVRVEERRTRLDGSGSRYRRFEGTVANRTAYHLRFVEGIDGRTVLVREFYHDGDALYERVEADGGVRYDRPRDTITPGAPYPLDPMGAPTQDEELYVALSGARPAYVGTAEVGGSTVHRLETSAAANPGFIAAWEQADAIEDYRLEATVTAGGVVRSYAVAYVAVRADARWEVGRTATWTEIGEARVAEPAWYETARDRLDG